MLAPVYDASLVQVGPKLKAARQRAGLSLRALGERTGFSASFLSQVELGQASPSLSSLGRIAQALDVKLTDLLTEPTAEPASPVVRRRQTEGLRSEWSRASVQSVLPAGADDRIQAFSIVLEPGGRSGKNPLVLAGRELAYCVRGEITLTLDGTEHVLGEGDSAFYDATQPRQWTNPTHAPAEVLVVAVKIA